MVYMYYKDRPQRSLTISKGGGRSNINISDRTANVFYETR